MKKVNVETFEEMIKHLEIDMEQADAIDITNRYEK